MEKQSESLSDLLAPFITNEGPEACVCILDDQDAKKVLAAWQFYPAIWKCPKSEAPDNHALKWEWAWSGLHVDHSNLSKRADVYPGVAERKFEMLRASRLIYPDGTISRYASGILKADVIRRIPKPAK